MLKLYRPVKNNLISQTFGIKGTKPEMLPLYNSLGLKAHNGIDFVAKEGEPVYWNANIRGEVLQVYKDNKLGFGVVVLAKNKDGVFVVRHWHFKDIVCKVGQILESGDLLGYANSTGMSTGHHDHMDVKVVKKDNYGNWATVDKDNGYKGCIDPTRYFKNEFILDVFKKLVEKKVSLLQKTIEIYNKLIELLKKK